MSTIIICYKLFMTRPLQPLRDQPIPPPSTRQVTSVYKRSDHADKEKEAFNDRINNRANEILGWTGGLTRSSGGGVGEDSKAGISGAAAAQGQKAFAKEMEKLLTRAETLMATEEYVPPKVRRCNFVRRCAIHNMPPRKILSEGQKVS